MVITMEMVATICTSVITYIFGIISKKFNIMESKYIPYQNFVIGLISGILAHVLGLGELVPCVIYCLAGSMGAGGIYDFSKTQIHITHDDGENYKDEEE